MWASRGRFIARLTGALWLALLVAFAPSSTWAVDEASATSAAPTGSDGAASSSSPPSPPPDPDESSSTSEPSPSPLPTSELGDAQLVVLDDEQMETIEGYLLAGVVGIGLTVTGVFAGVLASWGGRRD